MLSDQQILRIPGPTPIPPSVQRAMSQPMVGHRSDDFKHLLAEISPRLKPLFGTKQDVLIVTGTGTSTLEASVVNTLNEGDEALVLVSGAFGERFVKICEEYGVHVHRLEVTWGCAVRPEAVRAYLQEHRHIKCVFATHCETSTGVLNPIQEIAEMVRQSSDALFIVDGVSSIGSVKTEMDEWGIDILVTGSQKALMLPTGLAFVAVSERAWKVIESNPSARFYLDLRRYQASFDQVSTPFTPGVSLVFGLQQSLALIEEEGLEHVFKRHTRLKNMVRTAFKALDLPLLASDTDASPTVTSVKPTAFAADDLRKVLKKEFSITLAGGQQHLKGSIFRVGHMGYCSPMDVLQCLAAVECGLKRLGVDIQLGRGVAAAQEVYIHEL